MTKLQALIVHQHELFTCELPLLPCILPGRFFLSELTKVIDGTG